MGHMAFRRFENHLIVVSDTQTPTPEEWSNYLAACVQIDRDLGGRTGVATALIFTDGGNPDSGQRVALRKMLSGRTAAAAMVSDSLTVRTGVGFISLFNKGIKVFSSRDWQQAAAFASIRAEKHMEVLRIAVSLSHEVTECRVLRAIGL